MENPMTAHPTSTDQLLALIGAFQRIDHPRQPAQRQADEDQNDEDNYPVLIQTQQDILSLRH